MMFSFIHRLFLILIMGSINFALANDVSVSIEPTRPSAEEPFSVIFRISTTGGERPEVFFTPRNIEILGKKSTGMNRRTKFVNGKVFTEDEIIYRYEVLANKPVNAGIRDIQVKIGTKTIKVANKNFKVYRAQPAPKEFQVIAQVAKTNIFVGEGVTVRYYLLKKPSVRNYEIRKYPQLKKFLKRFFNKPEPSRNIEYKGEVFRRELLYAARVFPEKPGKYKIDPIRLRVQYAEGRSRDPFSNFGFGFQRMKTKSVSSQIVELNVQPLPEAPPNMNFTGLIGEHDFKLVQNKDKYLVNEAIELKFEVTGGGALEGYEGPKLYTHPALEEFETNSDLRVTSGDKATKVYEYTFLARSGFKIPNSMLKLAYFNPDKREYVEKSVNLPGLDILGGTLNATSSFQDTSPEIAQNEVKEKVSAIGTGIMGLATSPSVFENFNFFRLINTSLGIICLIILISFLGKNKEVGDRFQIAKNIDDTLKKGKGTYSEFFQLLNLAGGEVTGNLESHVQKMGLTSKTEEYLLKIVKQAQTKSYYEQKKTFQFKYDKSAFKELISRIKD